MASKLTDTAKKAREIVRLYPEMFTYSYRSDGKIDPMQSAYASDMGVGEGWYPIIKNLVATIRENDDQYNLENDTKLVTKVTQIKEKYAGLRFYVTSTLSKNHEAIDKAETESLRTCEDCGTKEDTGMWLLGWYKTCCRTCGERKLSLYSDNNQRTLEQVWRKHKDEDEADTE